MNFTFDDDELQLLFDIIEFKKYQRYDNLLYADYNGPKAECTIPEFVWNYCKNPRWATRLIEQVEKHLINCRPFLNTLAESNNVNIDELHRDWDSAMEEVTARHEFPKKLIAYSSEYSNVHLQSHGSINDVDGDLWHGFVLSSKMLSQIKTLTMKIMGTNVDHQVVIKEFEFAGSQVVKRCTFFAEENYGEDWYLFTPFKHPIILCDLEGEIEYAFAFYKDIEFVMDEECIMVFGILDSYFKKWISQTPINAKLCNKEIIRYMNGTIEF